MNKRQREQLELAIANLKEILDLVVGKEDIKEDRLSWMIKMRGADALTCLVIINSIESAKERHDF